MKVLVTGGYGQLGSAIILELKSNNIECIACGSNEFDIIDKDECLNYILKYNPDIIIHCAAYTKVDRAEEERELCRLVNVNGTYNVVMAAQKINAKLLYVSTDYVFDGKKNGFYEIDDQPNPLNFYGETKLEAEQIVKKYLTKFFIVRVSWLFGKNGVNFVETILKLAETKQEINVVSDQIGSPTYTDDLAKLFVKMIMTDKYGIYHATNEGTCSWAEYAEEIVRCSNKQLKINYITSEEFNAKAKRPKNSKLSKATILNNSFEKLPLWKDSLKSYLKKRKI